MRQDFVAVSAEIVKQPKKHLPLEKTDLTSSKSNSTSLAQLKWDTTTSYANNFAIQNNTIRRVSGDKNFYQLVGSDPLKGSITIKATIKNYGGDCAIGFGLLTESRRN